jgi:hypothetical protein
VAPHFNEMLDPKKFIGRAPSQVTDYLEGTVKGLLKEIHDELPAEGFNTEEVKV